MQPQPSVAHATVPPPAPAGAPPQPAPAFQPPPPELRPVELQPFNSGALYGAYRFFLLRSEPCQGDDKTLLRDCPDSFFEAMDLTAARTRRRATLHAICKLCNFVYRVYAGQLVQASRLERHMMRDHRADPAAAAFLTAKPRGERGISTQDPGADPSDFTQDLGIGSPTAPSSMSRRTVHM